MTLVVLLVLMNLIGRLVLLAASWAAQRAEDAGSLHPDLMAQARLTVPLGRRNPRRTSGACPSCPGSCWARCRRWPWGGSAGADAQARVG